MKLGFIYDGQLDILTPLLRVISDGEAAICYLAAELAKLGHNITLFSRSTNNIKVFEVRCRTINFKDGSITCDNALKEPDYDGLILVNNNPALIPNIKSVISKNIPIYLWTEFDHLHPLNQDLNDTSVVEALDGIICVSDWQRVKLLRNFDIPRDKVAVRFHAISPFFEELYFDGKEFIHYKPKDPQFAFIANPLEGLDILLDLYPDVINNYPKATIALYEQPTFSSLNQQELEPLIQKAKTVPGFKQIGVLTNIQLANELRTRSIFAYPNPTEICCSIPIMNAMAAGLYVITSNLGAIPEYCTEHGKNVVDRALRLDSLTSFIGQVLAICQTQTDSPSVFYDYCFKQSMDLNKKHTWRVRAREWIRLLENAT